MATVLKAQPTVLFEPQIFDAINFQNPAVMQLNCVIIVFKIDGLAVGCNLQFLFERFLRKPRRSVFFYQLSRTGDIVIENQIVYRIVETEGKTIAQIASNFLDRARHVKFNIKLARHSLEFSHFELPVLPVTISENFVIGAQFGYLLNRHS